jgi:hypothetical protein
MKVAVEMGGWHAPGVVYRASESHRAQLALQLLDLLRCALPHALGCPGRSAGLLRYTRLFQQLPIKAPSLEVLLTKELLRDTAEKLPCIILKIIYGIIFKIRGSAGYRTGKSKR